MYGPTTEENPGPARGARSGLAAYFSLGRLRLHRRLFKVLQLVSPRPGWASLAGAEGVWPRGRRPAGLGGCRAASPRPGCSGSGGFHTPSSFSVCWKGGRYLLPPGCLSAPGSPRLGPRGRPRAPERVTRVQEMRRKTQVSRLDFCPSIICYDLRLLSQLLLCSIVQNACV